MKNNGFVYLVGAGPGDPELISVKGMRVLREADCVIYDYLAEKSLLSGLTCELIYVGKQGSDHTLKQEEINSLI
jgi:uroporphyrinogen III methyltransferase/synthase